MVTAHDRLVAARMSQWNLVDCMAVACLLHVCCMVVVVVVVVVAVVVVVVVVHWSQLPMKENKSCPFEVNAKEELDGVIEEVRGPSLLAERFQTNFLTVKHWEFYVLHAEHLVQWSSCVGIF